MGIAQSSQVSPVDSSKPDLVLQGDVHDTQHQTYFEIPFDVPPGVHRLSVDFTYTGREQHTTLDLGIADPYRFRGNSGGNKAHFTIAETDATPSYLPGPIPAGEWKILVSVPNIRGRETSHYRAEVRFNSTLEYQSFALTPLETGTRWYRGDLHMHTAHSDGSCASQSGKRVPCPVFLTVQAAAQRGLDFIAISDHNADSQYNALRELQPYFDKVLLIPGREVTTFWGHFNIFGITQFVDYRVQPDGRTLNNVLHDVGSLGGIASINHADAPTGERCMGCGWTPTGPVDIHLFTGFEVVNGGAGMLVSADAWDKQLAAGNRLSALGGSDNHNALIPADKTAAIGRPTTVVEASELSVRGILDGIRRGRTFIDLTVSHDKVIDLDASSGNNHARMGGNLAVSNGAPVQLRIHVAACDGDMLHLLVDGREVTTIAPVAISSADATINGNWSGDGGRHWLRAEVRDARNELVLVSSPIYVNFPGP